MSKVLMPVAVHRWFERGEGWAFHPALESHLVEIIKAVESHLTSRSDGRFSCRFNSGQFIGEVFSDENCPNRLATGRNPSVLRIAYGKRDLSSRETESIYKKLGELELPEASGDDESLKIQLRDAPIIYLDEEALIASQRQSEQQEVTRIEESWSPKWGVLGGLTCALVSMIYSLLGAGDTVRWFIDITLTICLTWSIYGIHQANSCEEMTESSDCD